MDPKPPHRHSEPTSRGPAEGARSNGRRDKQDPTTREADARAATTENEVDHARRTATRHLALETLERVTDALMPVAIALAVIGLEVAAFVAHPWLFSLNLLVAPLGFWAYRRSRRRAARASARCSADTA